MTTHEVLVRARNRLADPANWEQGSRHYGADDGPGCAMKALRVASGRQKFYEAYRAVLEAAGISENLPHFNDSHSHAEVLAAFDKAIAATAPEPDLSLVLPEPIAA